MVLAMGRAQWDTLGTTVCVESGWDTRQAERTSPVTRLAQGDSKHQSRTEGHQAELIPSGLLSWEVLEPRLPVQPGPGQGAEHPVCSAQRSAPLANREATEPSCLLLIINIQSWALIYIQTHFSLYNSVKATIPFLPGAWKPGGE